LLGLHALSVQIFGNIESEERNITLQTHVTQSDKISS
jgi:hypothetical protein